MDTSQFLAHHGLAENPFNAEEARFDPLFERMMDQSTAHQDFDKILGNIERPSTAVVFGEKGSGKTAIRLMIGQRVKDHNDAHPNKRTLLVPYDDLNPFLDRIVQKKQGGMGFRKASRTDTNKLLKKVRLADHQDAILSLAVTRLVDRISTDAPETDEMTPLPLDVDRKLRSMPRHLRVDFALLAALYDQPKSGSAVSRWGELRHKLRLRWVPPLPYMRYATFTLLILCVLAMTWIKLFTNADEGASTAGWLSPMAWITGIGTVACAAAWGWSRWVMYRLVSGIKREVIAVDRNQRDLFNMLLEFKGKDLVGQPWPIPGVVGEYDNRFQLTHKLQSILTNLGYTGIMVLVDRVDEPSLITGKPESMKSVIWPMFDNKFLQQENIGIKLLLPAELRHELARESADFYQEARMDKQNMIDRLTWSGSTLYDMCSNRMRACRKTDDDQGRAASEIKLKDLFASDVTRESIVEALDQMHQPRDAFKMLYAALQDHCRELSQDDPNYQISRATLDIIRRQQAQRVQDLQRGMAPA
jgi:hypothetical protein